MALAVISKLSRRILGSQTSAINLDLPPSIVIQPDFGTRFIRYFQEAKNKNTDNQYYLVLLCQL